MKTMIAVAFALLATAGPAAAQPNQAANPPEVFNQVLACQNIRGEAERLACYDRSVAALAQAQAQREVVVVDREEVRRTRRTLFGLTLPDVGRLFGEEPDEAVEGTITHVQFDQTGRITFQLDNGAVWSQTEGRRVTPRPRPGMQVRIRRGALGSFLANIAGRNAVRVIRQR